MITQNNGSTALLNSGVDLQQYWTNISRKKWRILAFTSVVVLITTLFVYSIQPVYRATATLLIESQQAKIVSIEQIYGLDTGNADYYETQYEILKSRGLAEKVVSELDLVNHSDFSSKNKMFGIKSNWFSLFSTDGVDKTGAGSQDEYENKLKVIDKFIERLSIAPIRNTQLVKITFESTDRDLAVKVANALADAYIESHLDAKLQMTRKATAWLTGRMESLKNKLNLAEKQLQDFRDRESLVDVEGLRSLAAKELQDISTNLVAAQERRSKAENNYKQVKALEGQPPEAFESIPAVLKHRLIQELKTAKAEAERILSVYAKRYGPQHPKMVAATSRVATAKKNIDRQIAIVVAGIEKEFEIAKENEKTLGKALERSRKRIQELNRKEFTLHELEQEVETNRKLYNTFFSRFQETSATEDLKSVNARIMDPAVLPRMPAKPKKTLAIFVATFIGLFFGIAFTLFKEGLNKTLRNADDVEIKLGVPVLGLVPQEKLKWNKVISPLGIFSNPNYAEFAESIRTIRTSVILSSLDEIKKITLVTSSVPNEGKTTISASLGIALGQIEKVLLIDADMRRPSIGKAFDLSSSLPGLSNYVAKTEKLEDCVHQFRNSNLYIMPAGVSLSNPLELLSSKRFSVALEDLGKLYDRILIDTGPVTVVSDPLALSPHVQSVIYVVKAGETSDQLVRSGLKRLLEVKQNIAGVVLNHYVSETGKGIGRYSYTYKEEDKKEENQKQESLDLSIPKFNS